MLLNSATGSLATPMNAVAHFNYQRSTKDKCVNTYLFPLSHPFEVVCFPSTSRHLTTLVQLVSHARQIPIC